MENCKKYNKYFYLTPKNYVNYKMKKYEHTLNVWKYKIWKTIMVLPKILCFSKLYREIQKLFTKWQNPTIEETLKNNYDFTNKLLRSYKKTHTQKAHKCYRNLSEQNNIWKIFIIRKELFCITKLFGLKI